MFHLSRDSEESRWEKRAWTSHLAQHWDFSGLPWLHFGGGLCEVCAVQAWGSNEVFYVPSGTIWSKTVLTAFVHEHLRWPLDRINGITFGQRPAGHAAATKRQRFLCMRRRPKRRLWLLGAMTIHWRTQWPSDNATFWYIVHPLPRVAGQILEHCEAPRLCVARVSCKSCPRI